MALDLSPGLALLLFLCNILIVLFSSSSIHLIFILATIGAVWVSLRRVSNSENGISRKIILISLLPFIMIIPLRSLSPPRNQIPAHLLGNPLVYTRDFISPEIGARLMNMSKKLREFPTNLNDLQFYTTLHEHVGEAVPLGEKQQCDHPFLIPSINRTQCILPGRIDVGKHFILTGGPAALRERYLKMVSRVQSFGRFMFDLDRFELISKLFKNPTFQGVAKQICPPNKQHLDPFQYNFIIQVPGQTVATHIDAPYFWGATRFQFPQWLLASMVFSNLFNDHFVDQVQVVAYYHQWNPPMKEEKGGGGSFTYWDTTSPVPKQVKPWSLSGSAVDGSKTIHAAAVFSSNVEPPMLDKDMKNVLRYEDNDQWILSAGNRSYTYKTDDLRFSIVYRARCFGDEEEARRFNGNGGKTLMTLEEILETFATDMVRKGNVKSVEAAMNLPRLEFAIAIMNEYIKYPLPAEPLIYQNYCALDRLIPAIAPLIRIICR